MNSELLHPAADCTISTKRIVNAPANLVYRAWSEADHIKNWWGPAGFTNTFHLFDFWPGGRWSFVMHGPTGADYENESVFVKIEPLKCIVFNHVSNPQFQLVAQFNVVAGDKTEVVFSQIFNSSRECEAIRKFATGKNEENLDRLEVELEKMRA